MGMLAKKATEKKAALASGPVGFPTQDDASWDLVGRVRAGAIIREAALDLKLKGKYSNVNKAGRHNMIAGAVAGATTSTDTVLWVRGTRKRGSGAAAINGNLSMDWLCDIRVDPREGLDCHAEVLVGERHHAQGEAARRVPPECVRAHGRRRGCANRDSVALVEIGHGQIRAQRPHWTLGVWTDEFGIESSTPFEQIASIFFSGGFGTPRLECGDGRLRFGLGMPDGWSENWVEMTAKPRLRTMACTSTGWSP